MRATHLLRTSARLLRNRWERTAVTAFAFAIALGTFAVFAAVTAAAHAEIERVVAARGALDTLTVVAAQVKRIGNRDVELMRFRSLRRGDVDAIVRMGFDAEPRRTFVTEVRYRRAKKTVTVIATSTTGATVGAPLIQPLFGFQSPIGRRIVIGRQSYVVTAIGDEENIRIPIRPRDEIDAIVVRLPRGADRDAAKRAIARVLHDAHRVDDFSIRDERALIEADRKISDIFTLLLPAIAAISLAAGGVGIMTVVLLGVRERAAEIGLRRAIGATRSDVVAQFVVESLLIGAPAAAIGEIGGVVVATIIIRNSAWPQTATAWPLLVAAFAGTLLFATLCGLVPAARAAKIDPAAALRE